MESGSTASTAGVGSGREHDGAGAAEAQVRSRPLLLRRAFGAYWAGGLLSNTGTWLQNVSASIFIFTLTGSPLLVGVLNFATFVPILLFSLPAGTLADRVDRRRVVVVTQTVSLVAAVALTVTTAAGRATPGLLVAVAFVMGTSYAFAKPALSSLLPALVAKQEVARATAVNTLQFTVGQILGSALASLLLAVAGPAWAFGVNAVTFLGPIAAMAVVRLEPLAQGRAKARGRAVDGLRFLRSSEGLLAVLGMVVLANAATEALRTLAPTLTTTVLALPPSRAALIVTAYSGGAAGGLVLFSVFLRVLQPGQAVAAAFTLQALGVLGVALSPSFALTLAAAALIGIGFSLAVPVLNTALQNASPEDFRGRVMAAFAMAHLGVRPAFALLAGALAAAGGARVGMLAFGLLALLALVLLGARAGRFDAGAGSSKRRQARADPRRITIRAASTNRR
jgi:MFS family permease